MINVNVKPTAIEGAGEFETIPEGIYNVQLVKFEEWVEGVDRNKNPYHRAKFRLKILDGPFQNRQIMDSLFVGVNTPDFVLGNFLTSFTDGETVMKASDFHTLVGNHGRCSIVHNEVTKVKRDKQTGIEEEVTNIYENVKNFLKKEETTPTPDWSKMSEN